MKSLIDISDQDVITVINQIHILTENRVVSRNGIHGLSFRQSFKRYGSCYIEIEVASHDHASNGHYTLIGKCRLQFNHKSVWFSEFSSDGEPSNYNKNHFFGFLKLKELGYELPSKPQL